MPSLRSNRSTDRMKTTMSSDEIREALLSYPSPTRDAPRGLAHLMWFGQELVALGELEDNPGEDIIGALEIIAVGLIDAGRATRDTTFLHYLRRDYVSSGAAVVWQISWRAAEQDGTPRLGKPTWEPVDESFQGAALKVFDYAGSIDPYDAATLGQREPAELDLLDFEDLKDTMNASLGRAEHGYVWQEVAEMAFGAGSEYRAESGSVAEVVGLRSAGIERWHLTAKLALDVERGDSDSPGDVAELDDYEVTFEVRDRAFPKEMADIDVAAWA